MFILTQKNKKKSRQLFLRRETMVIIQKCYIATSYSASRYSRICLMSALHFLAFFITSSGKPSTAVR